MNKIKIFKKIELEKQQLLNKGIPGKVWLKDYSQESLELESIIQLFHEILNYYNTDQIIFSLYIPIELKRISDKKFIGLDKIKDLKSKCQFSDVKLTLHSIKIQKTMKRTYPTEFHRYDISSMIDFVFPENIKCMYFEVRNHEEFERYIMVWDDNVYAQ